MEKEVKVVEIIPETTDTKTFKLNVSGEELNYQPGQYVVISTTLEGKPINRSYSISNAPLHNTIDITIKAEINGKYSVYANNHLKIGDTFLLKGPFGHFTFTEQTNDLLLIAAGSGIAPIKAIIEYILAKDLNNPITLLYSNKTNNDIIFKKILEHWNKKHENFNYEPFITREADSEATNGRITPEHLQQHLTPTTLCYICGAPLFVEDMKQQLKKLGVEDTRIKTEKY